MKKFILVFAFLAFASCNIDNTDDFRTHLISIDQAVTPSSLIFGSTVNITVKYTLPNGCYRFDELYYDLQGNTHTIAVRALQDLNAVCTQAIIEEEYTLPLVVTQTQDYVFRFWKGKDNDGLDIFEEIVIPVN